MLLCLQISGFFHRYIFYYELHRLRVGLPSYLFFQDNLCNIVETLTTSKYHTNFSSDQEKLIKRPVFEGP